MGVSNTIYVGAFDVGVFICLLSILKENDDGAQKQKTKITPDLLLTGPGCSSLRNGAFTENGPFGVRRDGRTLYLRKYSWNRVVNIIYLESPAGVGFSYSNTSSYYNSTGDSRTASGSRGFHTIKTMIFTLLVKGYAGFYIPQLANLIIDNNISMRFTLGINLKGFMIENPFMDVKTDLRGRFDYISSYLLISDDSYHGLIKNCIDSLWPECIVFQQRATKKIGLTNVYNIHTWRCSPKFKY